MRLRRVERELDDYDTRLQTETKKRAALKSADVRAAAPSKLDQEIAAAVAATGGRASPSAPAHAASGADSDDFAAWFDSFTGGRRPS